jgi:hypothetical protein
MKPVKREICPEVEEHLSIERTRLWTSIIDDIVYLPRGFGSVKQWTSFADIHTIPGRKEQVLFLVDVGSKTSGRVAVAIMDEFYQANIRIVSSNFQGFMSTIKLWRIGSAPPDIDIKIAQVIMEKNYRKLARLYYGYIWTRQNEKSAF